MQEWAPKPAMFRGKNLVTVRHCPLLQNAFTTAMMPFAPRNYEYDAQDANNQQSYHCFQFNPAVGNKGRHRATDDGLLFRYLLRYDPALFHFLPQMGELRRRFASRLSSFSGHLRPPSAQVNQATYVGYPFATVSVFRSSSSVRQQYQLATDAYGRQGAAIVIAVRLSGSSARP
jgi:hypothetical protein